MSSNSSAMSGNDNCQSCEYYCDTDNGYYEDEDTCIGAEDSCSTVNISTQFGDVVTCYIGSASGHKEAIVNTSTITTTNDCSIGDCGIVSTDKPIINKGTINLTSNVSDKMFLYGIIGYNNNNIITNEEDGYISVVNNNSSNNLAVRGIDGKNVINKGTIRVNNNSTNSSSTGISGNETVYNTGIIEAQGQYITDGIRMNEVGEVYNDGDIYAKSTSYHAYGISSTLNKSVKVRNTGNITVVANNNIATGISGGSGGNNQIENYGYIEVSGKNAYGIKASGTNNIIINGDGGKINVTGSSTAYGIYFDTSSSTNLVANYGTIIVNGQNVGNAGIYLNGATLSNVGDIKFEAETTNLDDLGGTVTLEKGGTYTAKALSGNLTAGASLVTGSNLDTYVAEDSLKIDNTDDLNITSGSALFEASIVENDTTGNKNVVMTRSSFNTFTPNESIGNYLEEQYQATKLVDMFDSIKNKDSNAAISEEIAHELGYDIMPNFADENFTVLRSLNRNITETILTPTDEVNRVTAGFDNLNIETKNKGLLSGSELTSNTMYTFGDKRLDNKNRLGLGLSLTKISSDYETGGNRDLEVISIFMPYMHKFSDNLRLSSVLSFGMGFGEYDRDNNEADINDIFYGLTNELRYSIDLNGFAELEPALMLNAIGYTEDGFDEGDGENALESRKTHNLSVEAGIGLFIKKQFDTTEHGRFTMRVGGAYYRELASPFDDIVARHKSGTGAWYRINDYENLYDRDRALLEAAVNYDYKALGVYLKYNHLIQRNNPKLFDLGIKYNF